MIKRLSRYNPIRVTLSASCSAFGLAFRSLPSSGELRLPALDYPEGGESDAYFAVRRTATGAEDIARYAVRFEPRPVAMTSLIGATPRQN